MDDHTPGEWTLDPSDACIVIRVEDEYDESHANDRVIAEVLVAGDGPLVAAAPDLLAAARMALLVIDHIDDGITQALRAAIAKAEKDPDDG